MKWKSTKVSGELSVVHKSELVLRRTLLQVRWHFGFLFASFFSQTNIVFLIEAGVNWHIG